MMSIHYKIVATISTSWIDSKKSDIDFQKVLKIDPENAYARMGLGRNCLERKEYQKAIDYFDYVIALYPDYSS